MRCSVTIREAEKVVCLTLRGQAREHATPDLHRRLLEVLMRSFERAVSLGEIKHGDRLGVTRADVMSVARRWSAIRGAQLQVVAMEGTACESE